MKSPVSSLGVDRGPAGLRLRLSGFFEAMKPKEAEMNREDGITKIAVTDKMVAVITRDFNTNELHAEEIIRDILATGGLGMVRARGSYHTDDQINAALRDEPSADELRSIRMQCLSMAVDIDKAEAMTQFILKGKQQAVSNA